METIKKHTWQTTTGANVTATVKLVTEKTIYADGDNIAVKCCEKHFDIEVTGVGIVGYWVTRRQVTVGGVKYAATCGKLAISTENLNAIDKMVAEIEAMPVWQEKIKAEEKNRKETKDYEDRYDAICKMMEE